MRIWLLLVAMLFGRCAALAAPACQIPSDLGAPHAATPRDGDPVRDVAIGGYTLATVWMPEHCARGVSGIEAVECRRAEVRAAGLTLHGLWPDGQGREWPQWCHPAAVLPEAVVAAHYCATPSVQLLQHEWAKHGTCMAGYTPGRYFDRAEQLYRAIRMPDLKALSYTRPTVATVTGAIARANPALPPHSFQLRLNRRGWLQEIWFCLDARFAARACAGEDRLADGDPVLIWRGGRTSRDNGGGIGARDRTARTGHDREG